MSQTALANAIGVTFQQVQKYEKGTNRVGSGRLVRVAAALDVPVMTLLHGACAERKAAASSPVELLAHRHPLRLVQAFTGIDDKPTRRALMLLTEAIASLAARRSRSGSQPR